MNMQEIMRQARNMQNDMMKIKNEIDSTHFTSKNDLVSVEVNGKKEILKIEIDKNVLPDDFDVLGDMIMLALNNAFKDVDKMTEKKMGKYSSIQGLF